MIPRYEDPPRQGQRYIRRPGAYAILPRDGMVLITHQEKPKSEFQLPGGGIDPGETPVQALHREVLEETGYRIARPRHVGSFRNFTYMAEYDLWAEKVCHVFLALPTLRASAPLEPHHSVCWFAPNVVLSVLGSAGDRAIASRVLR